MYVCLLELLLMYEVWLYRVFSPPMFGTNGNDSEGIMDGELEAGNHMRKPNMEDHELHRS